MFGLIEKLRNKSETYRHIFALSTAFVVTFIIFTVWMTALYPSVITGKQVVADKGETADKPLVLFRNNMAQTFAAVKVQWSSLTNVLKETKYEANNEIEIVSPEDL